MSSVPPQAEQRKRRQSSKASLLVSLTFHTTIVAMLGYFAAREGLLGTQLKKIAVELVKEKPPEKPKEPEPEPPIETPAVAEAPPVEAPREIERPPAAGLVTAPPSVAPAIAQVPSFVFDGGKAVQSSSDPVQIYKQLVEYTLRSHWNRPTGVEDRYFVVEVEVGVDSAGRIDAPEWKKTSGHARWDESVRLAVAAARSISRPPPQPFPPRVVVRFDVTEEVPEMPLSLP